MWQAWDIYLGLLNRFTTGREEEKDPVIPLDMAAASRWLRRKLSWPYFYFLLLRLLFLIVSCCCCYSFTFDLIEKQGRVKILPRVAIIPGADNWSEKNLHRSRRPSCIINKTAEYRSNVADYRPNFFFLFLLSLLDHFDTSLRGV